MEQSRVRVTGPSRTVLVVATGALVAVTSLATALVVLTGTGGVTRVFPTLEPLPPAAAPPVRPPVVVLPPGALGVDAPEPARRSSAGGATTRRPSRTGSSGGASTPLILSLTPLLPAGGLLPPGAPAVPARGAGGRAVEPANAPAVVAPEALQAPQALELRGKDRKDRKAGTGDLQTEGLVSDEDVPDTLAGTTAALSTGDAAVEDESDRPGRRGDEQARAMGPAVPGARPAAPAPAAAVTPAPVAVERAADRAAGAQQKAAQQAAKAAGKAHAKKAAAQRAAASKAAAKKASAKKAAAKAAARKAQAKKAAGKKAAGKGSSSRSSRAHGEGRGNRP